MSLAMRVVVLAGLLATAFAVAAEAPRVFWATATLDVDATGQVTAVESDSALPAPIQQLMQDHARKLRFEPPQRDGVAVSGRTHARFKACAVAVPEGYQVAMDFKGHGPRPVGTVLVPPPRYPTNAYRNGYETDAVVTFQVQANGRTVVEQIRHANSGMARHFDKELTIWAEALRYVPETLDGHPVSTRIEMPVAFSLVQSGRGEGLVEAKLRRLQESAECRAAALSLGDWQQTVALDSPFRRVPGG